MFVSQIMSKNLEYLKSNDTVSKAISIMEKKKIYELPVLDRNKLVGMVSIENILRRGITQPGKTKIKNVIIPGFPKVNSDFPVEDAAELLFKSGLSAIPVVDNGKLVGMLTSNDIIKAFGKVDIFRKTKVDEIMSPAEVITQDMDIGTARVIMREKNYSILPVVDAGGKLVGVVDLFDILKAMKTPREKIGWYSMTAEVKTIMGTPVSTILNDTPVVLNKGNNASKASSLMTKNKSRYVVVSSGNYPVGVITIKDLLDLYIQQFMRKGIVYHIIGGDKIEPYVMETVERMIRDSIQKIAMSVPVQFLTVHIKMHDVEGLRIKYSVRIRLRTDKGVFMAKAWKWDVRDAVGEALDHLERIFVRKKEKMRDKIKRTLERIRG